MCTTHSTCATDHTTESPRYSAQGLRGCAQATSSPVGDRKDSLRLECDLSEAPRWAGPKCPQSQHWQPRRHRQTEVRTGCSHDGRAGRLRGDRPTKACKLQIIRPPHANALVPEIHGAQKRLERGDQLRAAYSSACPAAAGLDEPTRRVISPKGLRCVMLPAVKGGVRQQRAADRAGQLKEGGTDPLAPSPKWQQCQVQLSSGQRVGRLKQLRKR